MLFLPVSLNRASYKALCTTTSVSFSRAFDILLDQLSDIFRGNAGVVLAGAALVRHPHIEGPVRKDGNIDAERPEGAAVRVRHDFRKLIQGFGRYIVSIHLQ